MMPHIRYEDIMMTAFVGAVIAFLVIAVLRGRKGLKLSAEVVASNAQIAANQAQQIALAERQTRALERIADAMEARNGQ